MNLNYAEWKKTGKKKNTYCVILWLHLEMQASVPWPKRDEWLPAWEEKGGVGKGIAREIETVSQGDENIHYLIEVKLPWVHRYVKTYEIIHFKYVEFIGYNFFQ